ncbi:MAG: cytochrome c oxidase subunit II [Geminicoccaceae bacterium]
MASKSLSVLLAAIAAFLLVVEPATAAEPQPWQLGFQEAGSPVMEQVNSFHNLLLFIIIAISLFVLALLIYVAYRFNASRSSNATRTTHNTLLEVIWTGVPVLILLIIAVPSFKLLYFQDTVAEPEMTIKAIGRQWYWSYEYPDHGNFTFDAYMLEDDELEEGQPRLLATDNEVVVPAETNIRVLITASDVLHSWAMPSLGVKTDAVPGRLNETWIHINEPGMYYGQCSEICGVRHGFMPIAIRALPRDEFDGWVEQAREQFAKADDGFTVANR